MSRNASEMQRIQEEADYERYRGAINYLRSGSGLNGVEIGVADKGHKAGRQAALTIIRNYHEEYGLVAPPKYNSTEFVNWLKAQ
jgi:hypothetical protein